MRRRDSRRLLVIVCDVSCFIERSAARRMELTNGVAVYEERKIVLYLRMQNSMALLSRSQNHKLTHFLNTTEPVEQYLQSFSWNKVKYRADKPIAELITSLRKVHTYTRPLPKRDSSPQPNSTPSPLTLLPVRNSPASTPTSAKNSPPTRPQRTTSRPPNANKPATCPRAPSPPSSRPTC